MNTNTDFTDEEIVERLDYLLNDCRNPIGFLVRHRIYQIMAEYKKYRKKVDKKDPELKEDNLDEAE